MRPPRQQLVLALILLAYLVIGILYAALTPDWQTPDEPAHYNYIRQLAAGTLPLLEPGDYDQAYLDKLKEERFPAQYPISSIQYEDHQPPFYYLLATPIFWLFDGALLPLRLFSLLLGAGVILLTYSIGTRVFPGRPLVTLTAVALVAFIPQHIAMLAGVNNDSLAELLLAAALLGMVNIVGRDGISTYKITLLGLLLGAIFITKIQAYIAAPVLGLAILVRWRQEGKDVSWLFRWLVGLFGPALLLGALWWGRNIVVYGGLDWMGLGRHGEVVFGQPTTAGWIADYGLSNLLGRFFQFTFQSFWGMFGWMGVLMDARVYQALGVFTAVTALGFALAIISQWANPIYQSTNSPIYQFTNLPIPYLLALSALLTAAGYLWYNLSFVQHQGRYLFPALVPLGLAAGVGWECLTRTRPARVAAATSLGATALLAGWGLLRGDLPVWLMIYCCAAAGALWLNSLLPIRFRWLAPAAVGLGLAALSFASLFLFVIPGLS